MRLFLVLLLLCGCGGVLGSDSSKCVPACGAGQACCSEPVHGGDAGVRSEFGCVTTSGSSCPLQP